MKDASPQRQISCIDQLRRSRDDGAYHCPKCNYPFTRRSNLRRHYAIHTRSTDFKCCLCEEEFSSRKLLDSHLNRCQETFFGLLGSGNPNQNPGPSSVTPSTGAFSLPIPVEPTFDPTAFSYPSPISIPSPASQSDDSLDFDELLASVSNPVLPSLMNPSSIMDGTSTSQGNCRQHGNIIPQNINGFNELLNQHQLLPHLDHPVAPSHRPDDNEKPIYTRRQVEDMLNTVSNVFLSQMGNLLQRPTR